MSENKAYTKRRPTSIMWKTRAPWMVRDSHVKELCIQYTERQLMDVGFSPWYVARFSNALQVPGILDEAAEKYERIAKASLPHVEAKRQRNKLRNAVMNAVFLAAEDEGNQYLIVFLLHALSKEHGAAFAVEMNRRAQVFAANIVSWTSRLGKQFSNPMRDGLLYSCDSWRSQINNMITLEAKDPNRASKKGAKRTDWKHGFLVVKEPPAKVWTSSEMAPWKPLLEPLNLVSSGNPSTLKQALVYDFPWLEAVIDKLIDDLTTGIHLGRPHFKLRPTLLVGPPGGAKTTFATRLAELAGVHSRLLNLNGMSDNRTFAGTAKGWSNTIPSFPSHVFRDTKVANPVIILDEIDKAGGSDRNGDIKQSLLTVLAPSTAAKWYDECLCVYLDLSATTFIATANSTAGLPAPLLARFRVLEVPLPGRKHAAEAAAGLLRARLRELDLPMNVNTAIPDEISAEVARQIAAGRSLRSLAAKMDSVLASVIGPVLKQQPRH